MKRSDEEAAKTGFDCWLSAIISLDRQWAEVPKSEEPPDYFLILGAKRFAVEVTAITDYLDLGSGVLSGPAITNSLIKFAENVEAEALGLGILNGAYGISADPTPNFADHRESIKSAMFEYLRNTYERESAPESVLYREGICKWCMQKLGLNESCIKMQGVGGGPWRWEGEIRDELSEWLRQALHEKVRKLAKVEAPWILLLIDAYPLGDPKDWIHAISLCEESNAFHTIARLDFNNNTCLILKSIEGSWINQGSR
jgi:hypothetical protein